LIVKEEDVENSNDDVTTSSEPINPKLAKIGKPRPKLKPITPIKDDISKPIDLDLDTDKDNGQTSLF